jgi:hypothetical protein
MKPLRWFGVFRRSLPLALFLLFFFFLVLSNPVRNTDTWKHLVDGQYLYYFGHFPHYSTFTHAPVKNHISGDAIDWLGSLGLYESWSLGGYEFLHTLKFLLPVPLVGLVTWILRYRLNVIWLLANLLILYGVSPKLYVRAAGSSIFFLGTLLFVLFQFRRRKKLSCIWYLLPLLTLWSNVHGAFLMGSYLVFLFYVGLVLDNRFGRSSYSGRQLRRFGMILLLIAVSATYIKPFPNYELVNRPVDAMIHKKEGPEETKTPKKNVDSGAFLSAVKVMTHDIAVGDRPYMAPEFSFPLERPYRSRVLFTFAVLLPITVLVLAIYWKSIPWSTILPVIFVFWLAAGVERAIPFVPAMVIPAFLFEWSEGTENTRLSRTSDTILWLFCGVFLIVWWTMTFYPGWVGFSSAGKQQKRFPRVQFGRMFYWNSQLPRFLMRKFPDQPVYTSGDIGSYVLWLWWPQKKVYLQTKTSAYRDEFLKKLQSPRLLIKRAQSDNVRLSLISRSEHNRGRNLFEMMPEWRLVAWSEPYRVMYLYCKCEVMK